LSTRGIAQPVRTVDRDLGDQIIAGAYWLVPPGEGADLTIVASGPVIVEAIDAHRQLLEDVPGAGLMVVTSPDRLHRNWVAAGRTRQASHIERLLSQVSGSSGLITVVDGHPATLSWIASVRGHAVAPLGVERFGQSGDIPDVYRHYGIDADAIIGAAARLLTRRTEEVRPTTGRT
jgi:pyruvate dehydrogenase E1 component